MQKLSKQGAKVDGWETIDRGVQYTRSGAKQADRFLKDVRVRSDLLKKNPGSTQALRDALQGVRQTYEAVNDAINQFLVPVKSHSDLELSLYTSIASGRMIQEIERRRGHCKSITAIYIESGGLRDALPATVSSEAKEALDDLMQSISHADLDLFQEMTGVGSALAKEAAVITNLLLADQPQAANDHLRECASRLIPLQADLSEGMGRVDHLMLDLGIAL
jgi:hypothetical protein